MIIVEAYIDRGSTENYNRMISDARNNFFDMVLVYGTSITVDLPGGVVIDILSGN